MLNFIIPYSQNKDFGHAYNTSISQIPSDDDWICVSDGDVMFLTSDFGHQIQEIIDRNPNAGILSSITNRVGNLDQCLNRVISEDANILNHRKIAIQLSKEKRHSVRPIKNPISGHLMVFKKSTWKTVGGFPENRGILSVDNTFSNRVSKHNFPILLMEGLYTFHFYRLDVGKHNKSHLL